MGKVPSAIIATIFVGGCATAFIWLSSQPIPDDAPQTYQLSMTEFGCVHPATLARVAQLDAQGDQAAAVDYDRQNFLTGECIEFRKGSIVFMDDMHSLDGIDKVHAQGNPDDYWIASSVLKAADVPRPQAVSSAGAVADHGTSPR